MRIRLFGTPRSSQWRHHGHETVQTSRMDQTGRAGAENARSSKDTGSKDRQDAQTKPRSNAAKGVQYGSFTGLSLRAASDRRESPASVGLFLCAKRARGLKEFPAT